MSTRYDKGGAFDQKVEAMGGDGWTEKVDRWGAVTYEHEDDSTIYRNEGWECRSKPWALAVSDPPIQWDEYETVELAKAAHADDEWREHMKGTP